MVDERLLIRQLKQGSQTAFDHIYNMYAGALMGFCMQWTKRREINNAISRLPATQQKVVKLSRFSQLSNKEIAAELDLSDQTIKNQLSLGIKALRSMLSNKTLYIAIMLNFV